MEMLGRTTAAARGVDKSVVGIAHPRAAFRFVEMVWSRVRRPVMTAIGTLATDVVLIVTLRRDISAGAEFHPGVVTVLHWGFRAIHAWKAVETEFEDGEKSAMTATSTLATAATRGARLSVDTAVAASRQTSAFLESAVTGH